MKKEWFVLQALVGQENKALKAIEARVRNEDVGEFIGKCLVPTEKVQVQGTNGKKKTVEKKIFPGYVLAEIALYSETELDAKGRKRINDRAWLFIRSITGIIGFIGGDRPTPLTQDEIDAIINPSAKANKPARPQIEVDVGETVRINDGPFMGLVGIVSVVDPDKGKLKVEVHVFNRTVPVDVEYWQIEKVDKEALSAEEASSSSVPEI